MKHIESYNSSYPLAYYEIGTVYSFYMHAGAKGKPAHAEIIKKYAAVLNELVAEEQKNVIKPVKSTSGTASSHGGMNRFYAVVVDKVKSTSISYIVVMFCNQYNGRYEYYTSKYAVNHSCTTDGKDLMPASTHLDFKSKIGGKTGHVTLANKEQKTGVVTRADGKNASASSASIGGVTKVRQNVGGITLVKERNVGGVTRVKK